MTTLNKAAVALVTSVALGGGIAVTAAPTQAEAACRTGVYCSMDYAKKIKASEAVYGARNASVRNLQAALTAVGFPVSNTGYFGPQTRRALKAYQASRIVAVTGRVDSHTLGALRGGTGNWAARRAPKKVKKVTATASVRRAAAPAKATTATRITSSYTAKTFTKATSSRAQVAVAYAYAKLGSPYVYGATGPYSFDCSGLTQAAWRSAGVSIPRTSYAQYSGLRKVSLSNLQPGDIISFYGGGHVGIYVGDGYVIHAPNSRSVVKKVKMNTMPVQGAVRPA